MIMWAQSVDTALFRFINQRLANPVLDVVMPFLSGNRFFIPAVICLSVYLVWRGGLRGRVFVPVLFLILGLGDAFVINNVKHAIGRTRPYVELAGTRELVGLGGSGSMPSSHTSTWFAATLVAYVFCRPTWRFMLPLAGLVAFSRMYVGVHYPSDVLAGAVLGAGYAAAGLVGLNAIWRTWGRAWFPGQWARWPSIFSKPNPGRLTTEQPYREADRERRWVILGYMLIAITLVARLLYLTAGKIELSEDEAYQWLWSKHLALSYYSKPPLIAYTQFLGTTLWGDNELGVRFFSPVIAAALSFLLLRFMARQGYARAGFWLIVILGATPLMGLGTTLLTVDAPSVFFWVAAMIAGWSAINSGSLREWGWTGLWLGLGLLSKYTAVVQLASLAIFLAVWPRARGHWRTPGPYLAMGIALLAFLPVIWWNIQHDWITVTHLAERGGLDNTWQYQPKFMGEFLLTEFGLL